MNKIILIVTGALLLNSCGIYKKYERPDIQTDGIYRDTASLNGVLQSNDTITLGSTPWREVFTDPYLQQLKAEREFVLCGDVNIAHKEIDLKNWKSNQKNSGFLPEERAWMSRVIDELALVDVYRHLKPETTGEAYTWWSNRGQAYAKNVGWRLDYHLATPAIAELARHDSIYKDVKFSDHAPITIEYDFQL